MQKIFAALVIATAAFAGLNATAQEPSEATQSVKSAQSTESALLPNTLGLHIGSRHSAPGFNDTNPGLYARWADANGNGWALGAYQNSERAKSVWGGYSFSSPKLGLGSVGARALGIGAGLTLGGVTGYRAAKLLPLIVPSAALHWGDAAARLTYVPKVEKRGAAALHLSLEYRF